MHATAAIAALLDPFAVQGATGVGQVSGLASSSNTPSGDAGEETAADGGQFGDALAAAMAAAMAAPAPSARVPASAQGEVDTAGPPTARPQTMPASTAGLTTQWQPAEGGAVVDAALSPRTGLAMGPDQAQQAEGHAAARAPAALPGDTAPTPAAAPAAGAGPEVETDTAPRPTTPSPDLGSRASSEAAPGQATPPRRDPDITATHAPAPMSGPAAQPAPTAYTRPQADAPLAAVPAAIATPSDDGSPRIGAAAAALVGANPTPAAAATAPANSVPAPPTPVAPGAPVLAEAPAAPPSPIAAASAPTVQAAAIPAPAPSAPAKATSVESAGRSAKTSPQTASADGRADPQTARADVETAIQGSPRVEDDLPPPSLAFDDQPQEAEPETDRPAIAAAAPATAEPRAVQAPVADAPRATPQTVALLAAQIANKVEGKSTRFDVQLDPHGLGKVDVRVEISARGEVSAALTFENPQAAAELRGKAGELQTALEQAGFDLSKTSLSFNSGGQGQHQGLFDQQQQNQAPAWRGRAFTDLSDTPEAAPAPVLRRAAAGGVDVRI